MNKETLRELSNSYRIIGEYNGLDVYHIAGNHSGFTAGTRCPYCGSSIVYGAVVYIPCSGRLYLVAECGVMYASIRDSVVGITSQTDACICMSDLEHDIEVAQDTI